MKPSKRLFWGIVCYALAFIFLVGFEVAWVYLHRSTYFVSGVDKLSSGAMIAIVFIILLMRGAFESANKKFKTVIVLGFLLAIVWFLEPIIKDLFWIILWAIVGYVIYILFSSIGEHNMKYYRAYKDESSRVYARKEANSQIDGIGGNV